MQKTSHQKSHANVPFKVDGVISLWLLIHTVHLAYGEVVAEWILGLSRLRREVHPGVQLVAGEAVRILLYSTVQLVHYHLFTIYLHTLGKSM